MKQGPPSPSFFDYEARQRSLPKQAGAREIRRGLSLKRKFVRFGGPSKAIGGGGDGWGVIDEEQRSRRVCVELEVVGNDPSRQSGLQRLDFEDFVSRVDFESELVAKVVATRQRNLYIGMVATTWSTTLLAAALHVPL